MHVLLINNNSMVSRLLGLCTRDDAIILEEVSSITSIQRKHYDIVLVDEERLDRDILDLEKYVTTSKKVLLSNENTHSDTFDIIIKKPFLPSEIIILFDHVEEVEFVYEKNTKQGFIFPLASEEEIDVENQEEPQVLDVNEIDKIKMLLDMDDNIEINELNEDEIEARKIEVIKEQLIADGLDIVDEDDIVDELSMQDAIKIFDIPEKDSSAKSKKSKKSKLKRIQYTETQRASIEDAVQVAMGKLKRKKMKKLLRGKKVKIHIQLEAKV